MKKSILKKNSYLALSVLICVCLLCITACGKKADISSYSNEEIIISGLEDEEFSVTPEELMELECVSRTASGRTEKAGTVEAYGPLLDTFLLQYDCKASDFKKIRFLAKDSYKTVLKDDYLTDYEVVMAVSGGSKPLDESQQPLRILIPEAESGMWTYGVNRIEFERE